jgi:hypothetical protein
MKRDPDIHDDARYFSHGVINAGPVFIQAGPSGGKGASICTH